MVTAIMMLFVTLVAFVITPWIGEINHTEFHHTDLMAGDE
jgi:hypothetical protein